MVTRPAVLFAVVTVVSSTALAQTPAPHITDLQRLVFGIGEWAFPDTPQKLEVQLQLATAYASGDGIGQDVELACGLTQMATRAVASHGDDTPEYARVEGRARELCANVNDVLAALNQATCPRFGFVPQTMEFGSGALLVIDRKGWTIEDRSGAHEGDWPMSCGDAVASMHLIVVPPPAGSGMAPRRFLEWFIWHQSRRNDGTVGNRSLEWHTLEFQVDKRELNSVADVSVIVEPSAFIWPTPPVPHAVSDGATFRMLRTGEIRWRFDGASELGIGVIEAARR